MPKTDKLDITAMKQAYNAKSKSGKTTKSK